MKAVACLFDRIITKRLSIWICVSEEQSAYQKGKSTLNHLFTFKIIIALARKSNMDLCIGFFDIAKAFDHVSRYLLLKKLVVMDAC